MLQYPDLEEDGVHDQDAGAQRVRREFLRSREPDPHRARRRRILAAHPEMRRLYGREPRTVLLVIGVVTLQVVVAAACRQAPWWAVVGLAWTMGAVANHALYVLIHECAHDLVLPRRWQNQACAVLADLPNTVPSAMSFRLYHLAHHRHQGDVLLDADLASPAEAIWVGNVAWRKALWLCALPLLLALRPVRIRGVGFITPAVLLNWAAVALFDLVVVVALGPRALAYLFFSFWFSIGPHPLAARWIQEHYTTQADDQETTSYYGHGNIVALNVGYHNEHHDFPAVPWSRLPAVRDTAPEAYLTLHLHRSWRRLLWRFLTDERISLWSRVTRES